MPSMPRFVVLYMFWLLRQNTIVSCHRFDRIYNLTDSHLMDTIFSLSVGMLMDL